MDRTLLYDFIYALAATDGREAALFGNCAPLAREAFVHSLVGKEFPELWFELPLAGEPWFDLHALTSRESLDTVTHFDPATCGGAPEAFRWFAAQESGVRQLALSWDVSSGDLDNPAVQLLKSTNDTQLTCDFLASAGRSDAAPAFRTFESRLPQDWFACYTGVFPRREVPFLRVECIPQAIQQQAYADNPALLEEHLRQVGLTDFGDTLLERCVELAKTPFPMEFQFDVTPEGVAGSTFAVSLRFAPPPGRGRWMTFDADGAAGTLMQRVEAWDLADERWRLLADTAFSKRLTAAGETSRLYCFPAFLKLRWREGEPLDAKAYLMAGIRAKA